MSNWRQQPEMSTILIHRLVLLTRPVTVADRNVSAHYCADNYHFAKDVAAISASRSNGTLWVCYLLFGDQRLYVEVVKRRRARFRKAAMTSTERFVIAGEEMPGAVCEAYLSQTASSDIQYVIVTLSRRLLIILKIQGAPGLRRFTSHTYPHRERHTNARQLYKRDR